MFASSIEGPFRANSSGADKRGGPGCYRRSGAGRKDHCDQPCDRGSSEYRIQLGGNLQAPRAAAGAVPGERRQSGVQVLRADPDHASSERCLNFGYCLATRRRGRNDFGGRWFGASADLFGKRWTGSNHAGDRESAAQRSRSAGAGGAYRRCHIRAELRERRRAGAGPQFLQIRFQRGGRAFRFPGTVARRSRQYDRRCKSRDHQPASGFGSGVQGAIQQFRRRVRTNVWRRDQHNHQIRHEPVPRAAVRL